MPVNTTKTKDNAEQMGLLVNAETAGLQLLAKQHIVRYEEAANFIDRWIPLTDRKINIIDAGCGNGGGEKFLSPCGRYIGVNSSESAIRLCLERYPDSDFYKLDLMEKGALDPFDCDVIVSFDTLEHLTDPDLFLKHCAETLRKTKKTNHGLGRFICSVPIVKSGDRGRFDLRARTQADWKIGLIKAGFEIEKELVHSFEYAHDNPFALSPDEKNNYWDTVKYKLFNPFNWFERLWWRGLKKKFQFATCTFVCHV